MLLTSRFLPGARAPTKAGSAISEFGYGWKKRNRLSVQSDKRGVVLSHDREPAPVSRSCGITS